MKKKFAIAYTVFMFFVTTLIVVVIPMEVPDMTTDKVVLLGVMGMLGYLSTFLMVFSIREGYIK